MLPGGELRVHGWQDATMDAAADLGTTLIDRQVRCGEFIEFQGAPAYLKAGPLGSSAARRHGLRRIFLRAHAPRIAEYNNLCWLLNRLFETPIPHAAGVLIRKGLPRYQFLLTAREHARPFAEAFAELPNEERPEVLAELGREVARFHSLHFVHRDLYPRNLLLRGPEQARRIVFLDAWAGGPGPGRRGPAYDLGCFFLDGARDLSPGEQAAFLSAYFAGRASQESSVSPAALLRRAARARRRLVAQLKAEPARLRGRDLPPADWTPPPFR